MREQLRHQRILVLDGVLDDDNGTLPSYPPPAPPSPSPRQPADQRGARGAAPRSRAAEMFEPQRDMPVSLPRRRRLGRASEDLQPSPPEHLEHSRSHQRSSKPQQARIIRLWAATSAKNRRAESAPIGRVCALPARDSCHAPWRAPNWLLPPPSAYRHLRRVGIESGAPESRTDPLVVFPRSSARARSNHDRIACSVLRLRRDPDLHTAPGWMVIDYCCGQERGPGLAPRGANGALQVPGGPDPPVMS